MRVYDAQLLTRYRGHGICECCELVVTRREPHHLFSRGAGQLDITVNLMALCGAFSGGKDCHDAVHRGNVEDFALLAKVANREGTTVQAIADAVAEFRRLPKGSALPDHLSRLVSPTAVFSAPRKRKVWPRCRCGRGPATRRGKCRKCEREARAAK